MSPESKPLVPSVMPELNVENCRRRRHRLLIIVPPPSPPLPSVHPFPVTEMTILLGWEETVSLFCEAIPHGAAGGLIWNCRHFVEHA